MRQISRDEWERLYGRGAAERPMAQNIPGLPPADAVAAELAYLDDFLAPPPPADPGRTTRIERASGDPGFRRVTYQARSERQALDQAAAAAAIADQMARSRVAELITPPGPAEAGPMAAALAPAAADFTAAPVLAELTGQNLSPELAQRAAQYSQILDLPPQAAVELAQREQLLAANAATGRLRAQRDALPAELLRQAVAAGELGADPAVLALQLAQRDGIFDPTKPAAAQQQAIEPYLAAAQEAVLRRSEPFASLDAAERDDLNAQSGRGRKILGTGKRNPLDKVPGTAPPDPYLVPALLAPATETYTSRDGQQQRQPRTFRPDPSDRTRLYDPRMVSLALLDPRAQLDPALGYLRPADLAKESSGVYGAGAGVPTAEATLGHSGGLGMRVDPAAQSESVPMTLGQAVQDIIYRHRTPLAQIPDADVLQGPDGRLIHRQSGQTLYPARKDSGATDSHTYRVGRDSEYRPEAFQEFGDLIEAVTGQRLVTNERLQDPGLFRLQRAALGRALDDQLLGTRGPSRFQDVPRGAAPSMPVEGVNPTFSLMRALAEGKGMLPADTPVPPVARNASELAFYRDLLGPQMEQLRDGARQALATQQMAASRPHVAAINSTQISELNAPAPPPATPELLQQLPEPVRPQVEQGLQAPPQSPRARAAQDFLARFLRNRGL